MRIENPAAWEQERVRCGGAEEDDGGSLQGGITEAVDEGVDALTRLAQGAVAGIEAGVVGQVGRVEDGRDRDAQAVVGGGEDGRQARDRAAVETSQWVMRKLFVMHLYSSISLKSLMLTT